MARFRIRDLSGVQSKSWDVCTVLERKTWFGWKQVATKVDDCYRQGKEAVQAEHVTALTKQMEIELNDRVLFDTASVSYRESEAQKLLER
jgi:hypothetical protein